MSRDPEAIAAALTMGRQGDLLLIFADALTRSWKQVIKFKPEGATAQAAAPSSAVHVHATDEVDSEADPGAVAMPVDLEAAGFIRDERGLRFVGEAED